MCPVRTYPTPIALFQSISGGVLHVLGCPRGARGTGGQTSGLAVAVRAPVNAWTCSVHGGAYDWVGKTTEGSAGQQIRATLAAWTQRTGWP